MLIAPQRPEISSSLCTFNVLSSEKAIRPRGRMAFSIHLPRPLIGDLGDGAPGNFEHWLSSYYDFKKLQNKHFAIYFKENFKGQQNELCQF